MVDGIRKPIVFNPNTNEWIDSKKNDDDFFFIPSKEEALAVFEKAGEGTLWTKPESDYNVKQKVVANIINGKIRMS